MGSDRTSGRGPAIGVRCFHFCARVPWSTSQPTWTLRAGRIRQLAYATPMGTGVRCRACPRPIQQWLARFTGLARSRPRLLEACGGAGAKPPSGMATQDSASSAAADPGFDCAHPAVSRSTRLSRTVDPDDRAVASRARVPARRAHARARAARRVQNCEKKLQRAAPALGANWWPALYSQEITG